MAITWRQHIKNTMARMEKGTHLKEVLKEASKTWKTVKKDTSAVVGEVVGKTRAHRKRGRKGTKARKGTRKHKKSHRRGRRGGAGGPVPATEAMSCKGGTNSATTAAAYGGNGM